MALRARSPQRSARLQRQDIRCLEQKLQTWQSPDSIDQTVGVVSTPVLFSQGGLAFLRDASIGADFARARGISTVRIVSDEFPDFELRTSIGIERFEAVEADKPGRRRGDEYLKSETGGDGITMQDVINDVHTVVPHWLETACRKKLSKHYSGSPGLVIYLNFPDYGLRTREVKSYFLKSTELAKGAFDEVWILWQMRAYKIWKGGRPQFTG